MELLENQLKKTVIGSIAIKQASRLMCKYFFKREREKERKGKN